MSEMKSKSSEKDWRDLATAASRETDPEKLTQIVAELCGALDKRQAQKQSQTAPPTKNSA
jgi:hypothetical protein